MKRLIILTVMAVALAGCKPELRPAVPVVVKVPTPVSCKITLPVAPRWAVDALPLGATLWNQMAALRAERLQRVGYENQLLAAIGACQ